MRPAFTGEDEPETEEGYTGPVQRFPRYIARHNKVAGHGRLRAQRGIPSEDREED